MRRHTPSTGCFVFWTSDRREATGTLFLWAPRPPLTESRRTTSALASASLPWRSAPESWTETMRLSSTGHGPPRTTGSPATRGWTSVPRLPPRERFPATRSQTNTDGRPASHMSRVPAESRSRATAQWISNHVGPERGYRGPPGRGLRWQQIRRSR